MKTYNELHKEYKQLFSNYKAIAINNGKENVEAVNILQKINEVVTAMKLIEAEISRIFRQARY